MRFQVRRLISITMRRRRLLRSRSLDWGLGLWRLLVLRAVGGEGISALKFLDEEL
jgi:hypothetical protein